MGAPRARSTYGEADIDIMLTNAMAAIGTDRNDDLVRSLMVTALDMDADNIDRLELKIASQTLAEILGTWRVFSPYSEKAKVAIFGSARTKPGAPDYELAVEFGRSMAAQGWMSITGAGPGIMTAGIEGAGLENSFGVSIILPFEPRAADIIADSDKLASFRYFFTRKLAFMKESDAFALFPGGFGTLDEAFELLTLLQTGKSYPVPIVLLDHPGSTYWKGWRKFVESELVGGGTISENDLNLFLHTHDSKEAAEYICSFYSCYHSIRFVGKRLIVRLRRELDDEALAVLNAEFSDMLVDGEIEPTEATKAEQSDEDHIGLPRLQMNFDNRSFSRLIQMIRRINELDQHVGRIVASDLVHDVGPQIDD